MRVVYQGRRHSALRRVVNHWRTWAPHKRTKRRRLRDAQTQLTISKRSRLWQAFRQYTAKRRVSRQRTAIAFQHFRLATLHGRVQQWAHILDIKDAFEQLASGFEEGVVQRRAVRMLQWWREWLQLQKQKYDREEGNWNHMAAYKALRYVVGSTGQKGVMQLWSSCACWTSSSTLAGSQCDGQCDQQPLVSVTADRCLSCWHIQVWAAVVLAVPLSSPASHFPCQHSSHSAC
eukprot:GHUV01057317.1.p1 GENE.GHUV01057317.1~~GHUV01057317.1.p1  ORF type:complete len:232 (+),score=46.88 GHUV01057317.1:496-1191(+)